METRPIEVGIYSVFVDACTAKPGRYTDVDGGDVMK
jgi:hypothetical protein